MSSIKKGSNISNNEPDEFSGKTHQPSEQYNDPQLVLNVSDAVISQRFVNVSASSAEREVVLRINREGFYMSGNNEVKALFSIDQTFSGKSNHEIFNPELAGFFDQSIALTLDSGESQIIQFSINIQDKGDCLFEARLIPVAYEEVIAIVKEINIERQIITESSSNRSYAKAIMDSSTDGVVLINKSGEILDLNLSMAAFLEKKRADLLGVNFFNLFPDVANEINDQFIEKVFNCQIPFSDEVRFRDRWISYDVKPLVSDQNGVDGAVICGRDITEEKHVVHGLHEALEANKAYKEFLEQLINIIPDVIGIQDCEHKIIRYNEAGYQFLDMTHEDVAGKKCFHLLHREVECEDCATRQSYISKKPASLERFFPEKGVWFDVRTYPVIDEQGEIKYIIEHLRDITKLKEIQIELHKSEERFRELFNSSAGGILLGSEKGVIIEANKTFCSMTGYSREQLVGKHISESLFTEDSLKTSPFRFDLLKQGETVISHRDLHTVDGKILPIEMRTRIMPDGTYQSIYHDISDRKRAEDEISRQNQELRNVNAEKDRFFSIIAHDLRSPFSAILGLTEMIGEEFDSMNPDEVKEILGELRKSVGNLYKLLDNLLEWSMVQRNKKPFNPSEIILSDLVEYVLQALMDSAKAKSITVYIDVESDIRVKADRNMLETTLRNLFSNAVKFTNTSGQILVEAEQTNDTQVTIRIKDSGMGIPPEMLPNLFSVSARNNRRGTLGEPSTGLGLLLCKEFVEKNGGEISADSIDGNGSTFSFTVPSL
jgi:PAS domain S-box-containing protein